MSQYHTLEVAEVRAETREAVVVAFRVPPELRAAFRFTQGQHLNVRARIGGEEARRSYSICAAVQDEQLRILIKRQPGGLFSNWANDELRAGAKLDAMAPAGLFHVPLDPAAARSWLAIAAGSGITPVLSVLKTTLLSEPRSQFTLFYGNRASSTILFREELAELKDRFLDRFILVHVMSREQQDLELLNGHLVPDKVEALLRPWGPLAQMEAVFLCGPNQMNRDLAAALAGWGYPKAKIKIEPFAANQQRQRLPAMAAAAADRCQATLILDGRHYRFPVVRGKESLLDAGLRAGVDLRYSCKSGVCATCRAKLVQGQVDMDGNFALEDYEIARGFILTCQSYPVTEEVVVDFDQD
ncbi:MAG TPA: 2Fe-2S iron-sulfur cluster-binding protein [Terriglobales bacterium]|nr:2Fe-2S iron-sulfur cluster-binding protein [Terriglobales bacterium]